MRTVRISADSPLLEVCKNNKYKIEPQINFDGTIDKTTMVVYFPCKVPEKTPIAKNFTWKEQLDNVREMQKIWSDNSVSCTVYCNKEDLEDIKNYLYKHFNDEIKTVSFLLYSEHGFKQAPFIDISKEEYETEVSRVVPITSLDIKEADIEEIKDCEGGACPIK